jgi:type III secretion system low calcium response chaperone LcrH/SycD
MSDTETVAGMKLSGLSPMQKKALEVLAAGGTLKDVRGLSREDLETIYAIGYNLYNQALYEKAEPMFQFACFYEHTEARYWVALGNCRQMAKKYQPAIDAFGMGYVLDQNNPWPVIQAAICYLALQDKEQAADALTLAEKTIANSAPNETARQRIAALRQAL